MEVCLVVPKAYILFPEQEDYTDSLVYLCKHNTEHKIATITSKQGLSTRLIIRATQQSGVHLSSHYRLCDSSKADSFNSTHLTFTDKWREVV